MSRITDDLNKRTRQLENQKLEKGEELVQNSQYQNQIQAINGERMKNLAIERQDAQIQGQGLETMAMAGAMATQGGSDGVTGEMVSPQTQATLGKYGLVGQPRIQRQSHRDVQVKPNNIVINNTYNTTTTNNVSGGGPVQGRPVQISAAATTEAKSQGRFKAWLENAFAQQKEANAKRTKEYEKREWSLSKSVNKMLRKMEDSTRSIGRALDPRGIGTTIGSQLKTLMWLFGIHFLAKNWDKIMDIGVWIYKGIGNLISYLGIGEEGRKRRAACTDIMGDLFWFLTGDRKKARDRKTSLLTVFKDIFKSFGDYIKLWFEKQMALRGAAVRAIQKPDFSIWSISDSIAGLGSYLADILQAIVSPESSIKSSADKNISSQAAASSTSAREREGINMFKGIGNDTMAGDYALEREGKKYALLDTALDGAGKLREDASASVSQGRDILGAYNDVKNYGAVDIGRVYAGIQRLQERANSSGNVILDGEFLDRMFGPGAKSRFQPVKMKYVRLDNDGMMTAMQDDYMDKNSVLGAPGHYGATFAKDLVGSNGIVGGVFGKDSWVSGVADGIGDLGIGIAHTVGRIGNNLIGANDGHYLKLVAADDPKYKDIPAAVFNGQSQVTTDYYRIPAEALDQLLSSFDPSGTKSRDVIFSNIRQSLIDYGGGEASINQRFNLSGKDRFSRQYVTDVDSALSTTRELDRINTEYNNRLDNSRLAVETRAFVDRLGHVGNKVYQFGGEVLGTAGSIINSVFSGGSGWKMKRQEYMMDVLTTKGGLKPSAAAGVIGNLKGEGLLVQNLGKLNQDNGVLSGGIAGFASARGKNGAGGELGLLRSYAADRWGGKWDSFEAQANYLVEGSPAARAALDKIRAATENLNDQDSVRMAAIIWGHEYERFSGHRAYDLQGRITGQDRNVHFTFNGEQYSKDGVREYNNRIAEGLGTFEAFSGYQPGSMSISSEGPGGSFTPNYSSFGYAGTSAAGVSINTVSAGQGAKVGCCGDSWMQGCWHQGALGEKLRAAGFECLGVQANDHSALIPPNRPGTFLGGANHTHIRGFITYAVSQGCNVIVINNGVNDGLNAAYATELGQAAGNAKVYFCTVPVPLRDAKRRDSLSDANVVRFNTELAKICKANGWNIIDVYSLGDIGCNDFHPGAAGYEKISTLIANTLKNGGTVTVTSPGATNTTDNGGSTGGYYGGGYSGGYYTGSGDDFGDSGNALGNWMEQTGDAMANGELFHVGTPTEIEAVKNAGLLRNEAVEILAKARENGFSYNNIDTNGVTGKTTGWDLGKFLNTYDQEGFMEFWATLSEDERNKFKKKFERYSALHDIVSGIENNKLILGDRELTGNVDARNSLLKRVQDVLRKDLYFGESTSINGKDWASRHTRTQAQIYNLLLAGRYNEADELAKSGTHQADSGFDTFDLNGRDTIDGHEHGEDSREYFYKTYKYGMLHGDNYLDLIANIQDLVRRIDESSSESEKANLQSSLNKLNQKRNIYESIENNMSANADDSPETAAAIIDYNRQHADAQVRLLDLQNAKAEAEKNLKAAMDTMPLTEWYALYEQQVGAIDKEIESVQLQIKTLEGASDEEIQEFREEQKRHAEWMSTSQEELDGIFEAININDENYWMDVQNLYEKYGKSALDRLGVTKDELKAVMDTYENEALKTFTAEQRLMYVRLEKFKEALDKAQRIAAATIGTDYEMTSMEVYSATTGTVLPGVDRYQAMIKLGRAQRALGIDVTNGTQNGQPLPAIDRNKYTGSGSILLRNNPLEGEDIIASASGYSGYDGNKSIADNITGGTIVGNNASGSSFSVVDWSRSGWGTQSYISPWKRAEGGWTPDDSATAPYHQVNGKWEYGTAQGSRFGYLEGGDVTFHGGEYVIPKYMTQIPAVRADINKWEQYRTSTIAGQKVGGGLVKEPIDFTAMMVGKQDQTNELLGLLIKSNAEGLSEVAQTAAASVTPTRISKPADQRTFNYR